MESLNRALYLAVLCIIFCSTRVSSQRGYPLTAADKAAIVRSHNILRSSVSPAASNMREMVYSDELAAVALMHAKKCVYGHSDRNERARAAPSFNHVGENVFSTASTRLVVNLTNYIADKWGLEEREFYSYQRNSCQPGKMCGHYTQIIWADTNNVGCGAAFCPADKIFGSLYRGYKAIYLVCNYGPAGNWIGQRPYKLGTPCSDCPSGYKKCNWNLCSAQSGPGPDDVPPVISPPMRPAIVPTPPSQRAFCSVDFISLSRLSSTTNRRVRLEFTSSGPVRSYLCTFNRSYPKPCYSGQIFSNVPRGLNKIKVTPNGCGLNKRDALIQFYMF